MGKLTFHIAPGHSAGHGRIYHRICKSLQSAGHRVCLLANEEEGTLHRPGVELRSFGKWLPGPNGWPLSERWIRCRQTNKMALEAEADIYAFYSLEFLPWALSLRKKTQKPVIFDCMEDFEAYALQRKAIPRSMRRPLAWFVKIALRYLSGKIDAMVFSDPGTAQRFESRARRIVVVHNFPDLSLFPKVNPNLADQPFDLTYHGTFMIHILDAFLAIDDALVARKQRLKWRLIGHMPLKDYFLHELVKREADDRFYLLDQIPADKVATEVSKAKIGLIPLPNWPKYRNNIPQKLFEFMALGMPTVLSDLPPSRPFAGDNRCALMVNPDDPGAYAEAIVRLVGDSPLRREMGMEGRRRVETRYNWERESAKLVGLYEELLK